MAPSFYSGDDFVGVGGPREGFGIFIGFGDEAVDGGLEIDEGMEYPSFESPLGEFCEEPLDGLCQGKCA